MLVYETRRQPDTAPPPLRLTALALKAVPQAAALRRPPKDEGEAWCCCARAPYVPRRAARRAGGRPCQRLGRREVSLPKPPAASQHAHPACHTLSQPTRGLCTRRRRLLQVLRPLRRQPRAAAGLAGAPTTRAPLLPAPPSPTATRSAPAPAPTEREATLQRGRARARPGARPLVVPPSGGGPLVGGRNAPHP